MPGRMKAHEGSLEKETAQSCIHWGAQGLGTGLVIQAGIAHSTGARAYLLSSSFMALLWLIIQTKIELKICKLELKLWCSQVYSGWASVSSSD